MNHYRVHAFHVHEDAGSRILVTAHEAARLTSNPLHDLLRQLKACIGEVLTEDALAHLMRIHELPEAAREFLRKRGVLQLVSGPDERISSVRVLSKDARWRRMLRESIDGVHVVESDLLEGWTSESRELWVLLLPTYSEAPIEAFHAGLRNAPQASGLIAYFRFRTLCVSSVYIPEYRTPCHFCQVGWESQSYAGTGVGVSSISSLLRTFEASGERTLPQAPSRDTDHAVASAFVGNLVRQLAGVSASRLLQDEVTVRHELDLDSFIRTRHVAVHWPGCDCQYEEALHS